MEHHAQNHHQQTQPAYEPQPADEPSISPEMRDLLKQEALAALRHEIAHGEIHQYVAKERERVEIVRNTNGRGNHMGFMGYYVHDLIQMNQMMGNAEHTNVNETAVHVDFGELSADFNVQSVRTTAHRHPANITRFGSFTVNMDYGPVEFKDAELTQQLLSEVKHKVDN